MNDVPRYVIGLDPTPCHTGWALYDHETGSFTYGVFEPPKEAKEDLPRMEHMLAEVSKLLPEMSYSPKQVLIVIEGLAFNGRGSYALQLAGLGYILRREFRLLGLPCKDVAPTQAKKFLTGKGNADKNIIIKEVFRRYRNSDGTPVDVDDDNVADAINFAMIGRCLLGMAEPANEAQRTVIESLRNPQAKSRKKKAA